MTNKPRCGRFYVSGAEQEDSLMLRSRQLTILLRGGGDIATGIALRLYRSGFRQLVILETRRPLAVRRRVAFSEAVYEGITTVEGIPAVLVNSAGEIPSVWNGGCCSLLPGLPSLLTAIPVLIDPAGVSIPALQPDVVIEATLSKRNIGVSLDDAPLVIGVGPGFIAGTAEDPPAGQNVHRIIETNRGHNLGRVITHGAAEPNTGNPGMVGGYSVERVLRAPETGVFVTCHDIGEVVSAGESVAYVEKDGQRHEVRAALSGLIRGLLRSGTPIGKGVKVGDIDPRENIACHHVSDKALAIGGGVLEAILEHFNSPPRIRDGILTCALSAPTGRAGERGVSA